MAYTQYPFNIISSERGLLILSHAFKPISDDPNLTRRRRDGGYTSALLQTNNLLISVTYTDIVAEVPGSFSGHW